MTVTHSRSAERARRPRRPGVSLEEKPRGYLALTAALYPDGDAVCAEILEFDLASEGMASRMRTR